MLDGIDTKPEVPNAVRLIGYGDTKHGYGPACVVDVVQTEYVCEPHVIWFSWVSAKNKITNFTWMMNLISQSHEVMLNVSKSNNGFFEHFVKKGMLRKIGYMEIPAASEEIHMYQVKRRKL